MGQQIIPALYVMPGCCTYRADAYTSGDFLSYLTQLANRSQHAYNK